MQTQTAKTDEKLVQCRACLGSGHRPVLNPKVGVVTERDPCPECLGRGLLAQYLTRTEAADLIDRVRQLLLEPIYGQTVEESIRQMMAQSFSVPPLKKCTGEAHSNGHIDNCVCCAPRWGAVGLKLKVK